jgi:ABC-type transport system involved in multi-copper enzyme maturation permease subunit
MILLRCWLNDLFHRTSIRACFILETCLLLFVLLGVTKSTTQWETINVFRDKLPSISLGNLKSVEVLLLFIFNQSKLWILYIGVIGVSGFLGSSVQSPQIEMLLARPIPRWKLLLSQYAAMAMVFAICIFYLTGGLWLMIGLKVGMWNAGLLVGSGLLCMAYSISLPFLVWLIIWSRSTLFALLIFYAFCFVSTGLEFRSQIFYSLWNNQLYHRLIDIFYYALPQLDGMLADASDTLRHPAFGQALSTIPAHHFLYSLAVGIGYLILAVTTFAKNDY